MTKKKALKALLLITGLYLLCSAVKDFEFLVLKTDRTFLAENIFCKLFTIGVIFLSVRNLHFLDGSSKAEASPEGTAPAEKAGAPRTGNTWSSIGFKKTGILRGALLGFSLGIVTFSVSYFIEFLILKNMGLHPTLSFYIANFTISEQNVIGVSLSALVICILGNIVNVIAEEGFFRGLLLRIGTTAFSQRTANLIQAVLFGTWHIITVIVWVADGTISIPAALIMSVGYVLLAGILGFEWGLCAVLTGALWAGAFEHFFNNFIGNTLHVVTENGVDELQIIRIVLSNLFSLLIVVILTKVHERRRFAGS